MFWKYSCSSLGTTQQWFTGSLEAGPTDLKSIQAKLQIFSLVKKASRAFIHYLLSQLVFKMSSLILCLFLPYLHPHSPRSPSFILLDHSFLLKYTEVLSQVQLYFNQGQHQRDETLGRISGLIGGRIKGHVSLSDIPKHLTLLEVTTSSVLYCAPRNHPSWLKLFLQSHAKSLLRNYFEHNIWSKSPVNTFPQRNKAGKSPRSKGKLSASTLPNSSGK